MANNCRFRYDFIVNCYGYPAMGKAGSPLWCWVDIKQNVISPQYLYLLTLQVAQRAIGWIYLTMEIAKKSAKFKISMKIVDRTF